MREGLGGYFISGQWGAFWEGSIHLNGENDQYALGAIVLKNKLWFPLYAAARIPFSFQEPTYLQYEFVIPAVKAGKDPMNAMILDTKKGQSRKLKRAGHTVS